MLWNLDKKLGLNDFSEYKNKKTLESLIRIEESIWSNLADYLPYNYYDVSNKILVNDNSFGVVMQSLPIYGINNAQSFYNGLKNLIGHNLAKRSILQFLLLSSPRVEKTITNWEELRKYKNISTLQKAMLRKITNSRKDYFLKLANIEDVEDIRLIKQYNLYIVFAVESKIYNEQVVEKFQDNLSVIRKRFAEENIETSICNIEEIISLNRLILSGDQRSHNIEKPKYNRLNSLNDQIITIDGLNVKKDGVYQTSQDIVHRSFKVSQYPDQLDLYDIFNFIGNNFNNNHNITSNVIINYTIKNTSNIAIKEELKKQGQKEIESSEKSEHRNNLNLQKSASEWKKIIADLNKSEIIEEYFSITVSARKENIDALTERIKSIFRSINWEIKEAYHLHLIKYLSNLPMSLINMWDSCKRFKLVRNALDREVVMKLPLASEFQLPNGRGGVLLSGRKGQLYNINIFDKQLNNTNFNVSLMASSGSGKSVFLQELASSMLSEDVQVFILDIGESYKNICNLLEGDYISFDHEVKYSLDPFVGLNTGDKNSEGYADAFSYARDILLSMCCDNITKAREGFLNKILNEAILEIDEVTLDIIYKVIERYREDKDANEMLKALTPYLDKKSFGKYFVSDIQKLNFDNKLTVIEFGKMQQQINFLSVIVQIILNQITTKFLLGNRKQKFMIILDEAWRLLENKIFAQNIASLYRIVRKYQGSMVTCQQGVKDFYQNEGCKTIIENSSFTIFLKQKSVDYMKNIEEYKNILKIVESLKTVSGVYSELLISVENAIVIGRLMLDPFSAALYSTEGSDVSYIKQEELKGRKTLEIIEEIAVSKYKK